MYGGGKAVSFVSSCRDVGVVFDGGEVLVDPVPEFWCVFLAVYH